MPVLRGFGQLTTLAGASLLALSQAQAAEQTPPPPADTPSIPATSSDDDENISTDDIIVTAPRIEGSVETDLPPDLVLDEEAITSYGASSISDLLSSLSTQTQTGRGRGGGGPVVLLNGRRISGFAEIRDIPPEAIQRVETFPEEVALKYGYSADQRVVNFILKPNFQATTAELQYGGPTNGARASYEAEASWLKIGKTGRTNVSGQYNRDSSVLESERNIVPSIPGTAEFRTLLPRNEQIQLNSVINRNLSEKVGATFNLSFDQTDTKSLFGLSTPATGPQTALGRDGLSRSANAGVTIDGNIGQWRWTGTGTYTYSTGKTLTDQTAGGTVRDVARTRTNSINTSWSASGPLAQLPAGQVTASIRAGYLRNDFRSSSVRGGLSQAAKLGRDELNTRASLDIPLTSRRRAVGEALGDLSVNINAAYQQVGGFGGLKSFGYGLSWSPSKSLNISASLSAAENAPSQQQLQNPLVTTPGVSVYDYVRGETALVTLIGGGNPFLRSEETRDVKIAARYDVPSVEGLSLNANYYRNRSNSPLSAFPELTPEIEAAFPDRVVRDAGGRLVSIDQRAINYLSSASDEFRWGFNFMKQIGQPPQRGGPDGMRGGRPPGAGGPPGGGMGRGGGGGGFGRMMGGGGAGKRIQIGVFHTVKLRDEIRIAPGVAPLDLLNGSATGAFGGTPEHKIDVEGGWFDNGLGVRLNAAWQSGTTVKGGILPGGGNASDLRFSDLTTINLRFFLNFDQKKKIIEDVPFLKGSRLSLRIDNITNAIRDVRDDTGVTPQRYQPGYLDALGRTVSISFRKLF